MSEERINYLMKKLETVYEQNEEFAEKTKLKNREQFISGRSDESLKEWLADQYVPYNMWKNASREKLVELVRASYHD